MIHGDSIGDESGTEAERRRSFGAAVRKLRRLVGVESRDLARRARISYPHLRNIENGHRSASPQIATALDDALGADGMLFDLATCGDEDTMRRRVLLHGLTLLAAPTAMTGVDAAVRLGTPEVESLKTVTTAFRQLDNAHGGAHTREAVADYLNRQAVPMLTGQATDVVRRRLYSAVAELAQLAGWTAYDSGMHSIARRQLDQAREWAESASDRPLVAEIYAAMSHQAAFLGNGSEAVALADAALGAAVSGGVRALVAEARMAAAHGCAVQGNANESARLLLLAEQTLDQADRDGDPEWISYFGPAYLAAKTGWCMLAVGDTGNAVDAAEKSLDMDESFVRGRMFNLTLLASSLIQAGHPEQACVHGAEAAEIASDLRSARADEYLRRVAVALAPYRDIPQARDLIVGIGARLSPVQ